MKLFFRVILIFSIVLFFNAKSFAISPEAAGELKAIDAEILDTNYNHALILIKEFIEKYPECFDDAQKRVKKIMKARDDYAALSNELIEVIINDPENNEKKLAIIEKLQTLEKRPSAQALAFIAQAKSAAQFTYYRAIFNRIMTEGSGLVASEKYSAAVEKFHEGFTLYQFDFFNNTQETEFTEPVRKSIDEIESLIPVYAAMQNSLKEACDAFNKAVKSGNYVASTSALGKVQNEFRKFAALRNSICIAGIRVDEVFSKMKENEPEMTDSSFLPFLSRFTFGRNSNPDTGILGAMDAQRNILVEEMKQNIYRQIVNQATEFDDSVMRKDIFTVDSSKHECLAFMQGFAEIGISINEIYGMWQKRQGGTEEDFCPLYTQYMNYVTQLSSTLGRQLNTVVHYRNASNHNFSFSKPEDFLFEFRSENQNYVKNLANQIPLFEDIKKDSLEPLKSSWYLALTARPVNAALQENDSNGNSSSVDNEQALPEQEKKGRTTAGIEVVDSPLDLSIAIKTLDYLCEKTAELADKACVKNWIEIASFCSESSAKLAGEYESQYNFANLLISQSNSNKVSPEGKEFEAGLYPAETLELISKLDSSIAGDRKKIVDSQTLLNSADSYKSNFVKENEIIEKSISRLDALGLLSKNVSEKARQGILLATSNWNEGDLRYEQALQALKRDDFNSAREYLQRARAKYNESLGFQASVIKRDESDRKLNSLGEQITAYENTIVVSEVRKLKNQARNAYYSGAFEEAETLLARAKSRWASTNVEEDAEITSLTALVLTALSIQSGRVILPTSPLYPEMSQILSIANQYYDQGRALMQKGEKARALNILQQAKDKLRELQLVYPLNQEASLLTLKIDKLIDEKSFEEMFARRVNAAKQSYKNSSERQAAYTDLVDLYTINPGYPGLAKLVYDVEIEIGIRQKPVDKTALQKSKNLTVDAEKIVNSSRSEIELRRALSLVDQAIALNPQNEAAAVLKDRIQIAIGGKATVVLSAEDEMRYQKAIQELQNNNIIEAYALVQRLLQSPKNTRSPKVLDLQKKVQALL